MGIEKERTEVRNYTYNESWERVAQPSYETFFEFLETLALVDGRYPIDDYHAFYIWLSRDSNFQDIDGYPVIDIYEKNVIDEGMTRERFLQWCQDFNIPRPIAVDGEITPQGELFNEWYENENARIDTAYTTWTTKYKIDISEGAVMKFIDENAQPRYIVTDFDNRGMIVG